MNSINSKQRPFHKALLISLAAFIAVSGWVGFVALALRDTDQCDDMTEVREGGWELINPLLECATSNKMNFGQIKPLEQSLQTLVNKKITAGAASHVSLYFRDLNNGPWIGINEDRKFAPGSMLKVPLMLAYYRAAEADPSILKQEITFEPVVLDNARVEQDIDSAGQLVRGRKYSVESLIANMIIYSDNNATALLWASIDQKQKDRTYADLGIAVPEITDWMADVISVRDYAAFMRVLFNASYLGRQYSNHALELLTKTSFRDGLVSGLPVGTRVAHKFGIRLKDGVSTINLHDCGIVYAPDKPFLLCVMTKGHSLQQQAAVISEIARTVYETVTAGNR